MRSCRSIAIRARKCRVTQFDYEDAEKAGLVKFDFLGLKTLTVIAKPKSC
jgi:DNA polymerase III alpha subunit